MLTAIGFQPLYPTYIDLGAPFLFVVKTEKVCTSYAPAMQFPHIFRGIDSNLRPCVLRSVVNPPFWPLAHRVSR